MKIEKRDLMPMAAALDCVLEFIADYSPTVTSDKRRRDIDASAIMLRTLRSSILKSTKENAHG